MDTKQGILSVNGTCLYYESAGSGEAVVFLHGFTLDTRMWDDQFFSLAQQYRVMRYDLRGFGQSALPTDAAYSHVEDLKALLDQLGMANACLVGLSKGGAVALDFAISYPSYAKALVLIDTVLGGFQWSPEGTARDSLVWQRAQEGGVPAAKESWLTHPLFVPALAHTAVSTRLKQIINDYSGWHFLHNNPELSLDPPAAQRLQELKMPVLAVVGELDLPDFRQISEEICRQVPQANKLVVPGAGHMANMEAPEQVLQAISAFLTQL